MRAELNVDAGERYRRQPRVDADAGGAQRQGPRLLPEVTRLGGYALAVRACSTQRWYRQ